MNIIDAYFAAVAQARTTEQKRAILHESFGDLKFPVWIASDALGLPNQEVEALLDQMVNEGLLELTIGKVLNVYRFTRAP